MRGSGVQVVCVSSSGEADTGVEMMGECLLVNRCGGLDLRLACNRIGAGQLALQNGDPAPLACLGRDPQEGFQRLPFPSATISPNLCSSSHVTSS